MSPRGTIAASIFLLLSQTGCVTDAVKWTAETTSDVVGFVGKDVIWHGIKEGTAATRDGVVRLYNDRDQTPKTETANTTKQALILRRNKLLKDMQLVSVSDPEYNNKLTNIVNQLNQVETQLRALENPNRNNQQSSYRSTAQPQAQFQQPSPQPKLDPRVGNLRDDERGYRMVNGQKIPNDVQIEDASNTQW